MKKLKVLQSAFIALLVGFAGNAPANVYTTNAQFDLGILNSVNHDNPNDDQLQLSETGSTFPILWAANAGEDSVSKIDTDLDCEVACYATWFVAGFHTAWQGPAPSRTAVDSEGNVYVANRQFTGGQKMNVLKILSEGGIDRNGNGHIDTSTDDGDCIIDRNDPLEFIPPVDDGGLNGLGIAGDGILQSDEIRDERVVWINHVGPTNSLGRSLCIGTDGNLWLGDYTNSAYYKINATDGTVMAGPIASTGVSPYGCLVDGDGILYSASLGGPMGILDTNAPPTWLAALGHPGSIYGIGLGNNKVYLSGGSSYVEYDPNGGPIDTDPTTGTFIQPGDVANSTLGISTDGDGNIVLGSSIIRKYNSAGTTLWATTNVGASDTRGVVPDSNNNIWAVNRGSNNATKFNKVTGSLIATVPIGDEPYTYSDATGFAATNTTDPSGIWTIIEDGGALGNPWDEISWNNEPEGNIPAGASIDVEARVADTKVGLGLEAYVAITNGLSGLAMNGKFMQVRATLRPDDDGLSPVLSDLAIIPFDNGEEICDVDLDLDIDRMDLRAISMGRGQIPLPGDPRDSNMDGMITPADIKVCIPMCTLPRCAIPNDPQ